MVSLGYQPSNFVVFGVGRGFTGGFLEGLK
jgi:hypothetical protein